MQVTDGHLLGGRVRYAQPEDGYRTGIEPVFLAAAVPAVQDNRVLEAGTGAGAGLLCLLARVPGVQATGVEIDPAMADLARRNFADNGFAAEIVTLDLVDLARGRRFDHVFANPPWHDPRATASPLAPRRTAKQALPGQLERWIATMADVLVAGGTLSLILPARQVERAAGALGAAGLPALIVQPLVPKAGRPAKLAIVQAWAGQAGALIQPALVLHADDGRFTEAANAVLRHGSSLSGLTTL